MFIKNIIISGFRSYREQSFPDGLSPRTNVIVGKNGSGKSNFFSAVQFVLSEKFFNLSAVERKELFHVGSGRPSLSIFVEIVFDNSDGRIVIPGRAEELEIRIRRTVGLKQDEFRVNDRRFTANEVHQLLESAGFSSNNPYYIVEQSRITHLVTMNEEERYQIIKDIAGTKIYDERRSESKRILDETKSKQEQISHSISQLEGKLRELEKETIELKELQDSEHEKKCLEYCIFNLELENCKEGLFKLEAEWSSRKTTLFKNQESETLTEQEIQTCEDQLAEISGLMSRLETERESIEKEISILSNKQTVIDLDANDGANSLHRVDKEYAALLKESSDLENVLAKVKKDALDKRDMFKKSESLAIKSLEEVDQIQKLADHMQEKRNRNRLFKNQTERDRWITNEISKNKETIDNSRSELQSVEKEITSLDEAIKLRKITKDTTHSVEKVEKDLESRETKITEALTKRNNLNQKRRQLWQIVHEQENVVKHLEESLKRTHQKMERIIPYEIRQGLQSLQEILKEFDANTRKAVHGPLIDLISVEDGFQTAVEIGAGNTLFNVVVDTFEIGAMVLEKINKKRKPGRISFFPLDTCKGFKKNIPETPECSSLLSKVSYNDRFTKVVAEVFGRVAVVASLESGLKFTKELHLDVITLDGDQLGRKGAITGGYIDKLNMKLPIYANEKSLTLTLTEARKKLDDLCQELASVEQCITEVLNELEFLRAENISTERKADEEFREARQREEHILRLSSQKETLLSTKRTLAKNIQESIEVNNRLQDELGEKFKINWTEEEELKLEKLSEELASMKINYVSLQAQPLHLATEVQLMEDKVQHMERRKAMIADRIREIGWSKRTTHGLDRERDSLKHESILLNDRLNAIKKSIDASIQQKEEIQKKMENLNLNQLSKALSLQEKEDIIDKTQAQRNLLLQRQDEALNKLRKLGIVPKGSEKYANFSLGKLMHQLKCVNESLKKYSHVNRKAIDQYTALQQSSNELVVQQTSLEQELKSIYDLINHLDMKKDEAINRTYKQIQYHFEEVFKELLETEDTYAELQLVKSKSNKDEDPYCAARICVSFGMGTVVSELEQLSGGQKSLVALTFIFAIQRCDPAPFYLFDEIDAALDAEYRMAVSNMIHKQSEECQFIIATFKTEFLTTADKVLGIFFHNKVSRIQTISMEEGIKMLRQVALADRKRNREAEYQDQITNN
ncbi:unnamed protein product [Phytomonas sp. Hart1]|nr:unnamed protein product [Phytomonas sp. Hart1]|eukprot:CCW68544.1 unnamed protein product [Phytomonas sp. isolate Hart1]